MSSIPPIERSVLRSTTATSPLRVALALALALLVGASGCTVLADLEDFGANIPACEAGTDDGIRDLWLALDGMEVHAFQRVEVRVVSDSTTGDDFLVGLAVLDGLPGGDHTLFMRRAVPPGPHRVDFWADRSGNRRYDAPPVDHAWSLTGCVSGAYRFTHAPNFEDIENPPPRAVGGDLTLRLSAFQPHLGNLLEVFVVSEDAAHRTVGYYRMAEILAPETTVRIPGVVEPDVEYTVAFYADLNGNKRYDPPETDHAWAETRTADASGIQLDFTHNLQFTDIGDYVPRELYP